MMLPNVGNPQLPYVSTIETNLTDRVLKVWRCTFRWCKVPNGYQNQRDTKVDRKWVLNQNSNSN